MVLPHLLAACLNTVPAGRWGVAVSGGADSVALLRLLMHRPDVTSHVIHLDHETRDGESTSDARFVQTLCQHHGLSATLATRSEMEAAGSTQHAVRPDLTTSGSSRLSAYPMRPVASRRFSPNLSARFRDVRLALYRSAVEAHHLQGVLTAHHQDDVAETVLLRLLRGGGYSTLTGMATSTVVAGITLLRPLLLIRRAELRVFLQSIGQGWREDDSNTKDDYARNRVRKALQGRPDLVQALLSISKTSSDVVGWVDGHVSAKDDRLQVKQVAALPDVLADALVAQWLTGQGVSANRLTAMHVSAVVRMCRNPASAARHAAPNGWMIRRRGGWVWAERG